MAFADAVGYPDGIATALAGLSGEYCLRLRPRNEDGEYVQVSGEYVAGLLTVTPLVDEPVDMSVVALEGPLSTEDLACAVAVIPVRLVFEPEASSGYPTAISERSVPLEVLVDRGVINLEFGLSDGTRRSGVSFDVVPPGRINFSSMGTRDSYFVARNTCELVSEGTPSP
ncbi:MAG: hypothetical protein H6706_19330 [Myxococcales bacterium]|nr:hypothetical protein [Myxococcales bacterium]